MASAVLPNGDERWNTPTNAAALGADLYAVSSKDRPASLYLPMDQGSEQDWPFDSKLAANPPPSPNYFPKSPSAINPVFRDPSPGHPPAAAADNSRLSANNTSSSSSPQPSSSSTKPRPFYSHAPSLSLGAAAPQPIADLAATLDSAQAWILYYFFFNLGLTLYNKLVLVKFPFPWTLTGIHTLCGAAGAQIALNRGFFVQARLTRREAATLGAFSALYTVNIAVSNLSLNLVTVPVSISPSFSFPAIELWALHSSIKSYAP
jgi:hypothetical protein